MKVMLPTPLVDYTGGQREVSAQGGTVDELLRDLDRQYPGIRFRMINEQDRFRPHIRLFVNAELERTIGASLKADDDILIVAALSGG
ncbi:MAG: MoaD/ThiS family protein [Betaproteobacteria bacterium]|nr:MoaD/ThiS family protein [Betaproteobacteria bacterium]